MISLINVCLGKPYNILYIILHAHLEQTKSFSQYLHHSNDVCILLHLYTHCATSASEVMWYSIYASVTQVVVMLCFMQGSWNPVALNIRLQSPQVVPSCRILALPGFRKFCFLALALNAFIT